MAVKILIVINDPPYGAERCYNALRLANRLLETEAGLELTVFLMGDAVIGAKRGQKTPDGYYNIERMLKLTARKGQVLLCSTCMDARALLDGEVLEGARRSSMQELSELVLASDKTLVF